MRLFLLCSLAMLAFAANSVLSRMAVGGGLIEPLTFAVLRVAAGAAMLAALVALRPRPGLRAHLSGAGRIAGVAGLLTYILGFSLAYLGLATGTGALILFGTVQITMFLGAFLARDPLPIRRWLGALIAFAGLVLLLAPQDGADGLSVRHAALMVAAGIGWGIYSLAGRKEPDALAASAANFLLALPPLLLASWVFAAPDPVPMQAPGLAMALVSGAITSGLGYALWYQLLPQLGAGRAAVAQLTVPVIAAAAGLLILAEPLTLRFLAATALVLFGVGLASLNSQSALPRR